MENKYKLKASKLDHVILFVNGCGNKAMQQGLMKCYELTRNSIIATTKEVIIQHNNVLHIERGKFQNRNNKTSIVSLAQV